METPSTSSSNHVGSCHCRALRYEVDLPADFQATMCNCTVCLKIGARTAIVKPAAFRLTSGEDSATTYGNAIGARYFCKRCGVHCYGTGSLPELGGAFVSVNLNTLDDMELAGLPVVYWDGRHDNWMAGPRPAPWRSLS